MAAPGIKSVFKPKLATFYSLIMASVLVYAERNLNHQVSRMNTAEQVEPYELAKAISFFWHPDQSSYHHVWPEMRFGWQIVVGTVIGFFGAAFGSVGGVGGGGIFVPMLTLIIGFDPKSATAISKCMIMGAAISTAIHNLKLRHPTLDLPIIDYDLVLLIQPVLMLGISIGVTFNVIFPDWLVTVLLIVLLIATAVKAFFKGVETWEKETILKEVAAKNLESAEGNMEVQYKPLPGNPARIRLNQSNEQEVTILKNIRWKELGFLVFVWISYLVVQIAKNYSATCSTSYWAWNLMQVPVSVAVFLYEAIGLYKGRRTIASRGDELMSFPVRSLLMFCLCGLVAGIVGGLLGIGGGFVMGPLFIELGIPPQVASATATFGMMFSSSMSVVEYYLLNRFPVPYALYFIIVSTIAAFIGQYVITKLIAISGRASLIIFVLAFTIFISTLSLGGVGITNIISKIKQGEYIGFENLCNYTT